MREGIDLAGIDLLEPATVAVRSQILRRFLDWFELCFDGSDFFTWLRVPSLAVYCMVGFGCYCFETGCPLLCFRQFLAHMQREYLQLRVFMGACLGDCI